ncbi:MAG: nuclease A inhibitor family protein [Gloeobacterales cyanobacterium]
MTSPDTTILDTLKQASAGLQYTSESDYPFQVFSWPLDTLTPKKLLAQTEHPKDTAIQLEDFDKFFAQATQEKDWYGPEEKKTVAQYKHLVHTLQTTLRDIQVFRVGQIELDVYIVGKTPEGSFVGLSTKVVET